MTAFSLQCPAKINLSLHIGEKLAGGYHEVTTIMAKIPLYDLLEIKELGVGQPDRFTCDRQEIPVNQDNLIIKLLSCLRERFQFPGLELHLTKKIPVGAGLGGGSSDAGCLLTALNQRYELGLNQETLTQLALELGADVPFFTRAQTVTREIHHGLPTLVSQPLPKLPECQIVLVYQEKHLETPLMYRAFDQQGVAAEHADGDRDKCLLTALQTSDWREVPRLLTNDFWPVAIRECPAIVTARTELIRRGALAVNLTGKGPTVFGIFKTDRKIDLPGKNYQLITKGNHAPT